MTACVHVGFRRGCGWVLAVSVFASVGLRPARGADGNYVMPGGRKIKMTRSTSEYAVTLRECAEHEACTKRLAESKVGVLEDFQHAPRANVKLLRVEEMSAEKMTSAKRDPAIVEIRRVYRFETSDAPVVSTGTVVVKVRPELSARQREAIWAAYDIASAQPMADQRNVYLITPTNEDEDIDLAERLSADAGLVWATPNLRRPILSRQVVPADPFYNLQWHLQNVGQLGGVVDADIDAPEAWALATGEGVLIGMFDDACDVDHEDLIGNYAGFGHDATLTEGAEGSDDPRPKIPEDRHGTAVMGLAVASGNSLGGRGVAYDSTFTVSRGLGDFPTDVQVARAFNFARDRGVDVHNNSWGFRGGIPDPPVIVDAIELAFLEGRNRGDLDGDGDDDPLGMVVVFASGNDGRLLDPGFELSMLPQVIGVGGTDDGDALVSYSNYGTGIDVLAPTGGLFSAQLLTTDNTDYPEGIDLGYNVGGSVNGFDFVREADTEGKYTRFFNGTSASCPIATGVAALILSVNPELTATDVRLILEHTTDRVDAVAAAYDGTTSRSLKFGYGRLNAGGSGDKVGAVEAAQSTLSNGGFTWPERVAETRVEGIFLRWRQNLGSSEFLVVASDAAFTFAPEDGVCYSSQQPNCSTELSSLPAGVEVLKVGCALSCDAAVPATCATGAEQCVVFEQPTAGARKYFAIYARNTIGRYSFGVAANSAGDILDDGDIASESTGTGGANPPPPGPAVSINVSPLEGTSPLTVNFSGNAVSTVAIDEERTIWDFDTDDANPIEASTRSATHTYVVPPGLSRTFTARLTMVDTDGRAGYAEVGVLVEGGDDGSGSDPVGSGDLRITFGLPNSPGSDVTDGQSPLTLLLSVDAGDLTGTVQSVVWDLGDGDRATGLSVPHTYENTSDADLRFPVTVTITTVSAGGATVISTGTRFLTVTPGLPVVDPGDPDLPGTTPGGAGGTATPCQGLGLIPLLTMFFGLTWMRRRG